MNIKELDLEGVAALLQERVRERGLSMKALSGELEWPLSITHMILTGRRTPSMGRLIELANYLDIEVEEFPKIDNSAKKPVSKGNKIFVSYSHRDREYLDRLMIHLKPLERQGLIDSWVDTKLQAGDKWKKEIETALSHARVAVLLISADFLASDFIINNELPPLIHAAENKGTLVLPVILKPCRFTREKNLNEFQSINAPDEPLSLLNENERELVYDTVAQRIERIFE